ncbi:MAG: sulfotransferase family protein [Candidatus Sulfotelmatobacter sp.]
MIPERLTQAEPSQRNAPSQDSPIFIVGMSRSGTTLLSRMLDAHSEIAIFPETWWCVALDRLGCLDEFTSPWQTALFFHELWSNVKTYRDPAAQVVAQEAALGPRYTGPTGPLLEQLGKAYAQRRQASIWGEKTPGHALWLPQIKELFPRARVLFSVRDPRDVLVSYDERWNQGRLDTEYLISTAALLKYYLTRLLETPAFPAEQVSWVRYETLTAHPADELERICDFLGVKFETSMLDFYHRHANVERDMADGQHHALLSRPATTDHIGRYQKALSASQIALVERLLATEMPALGYPLSCHSRISFSALENRAYAKAEEHYREMASGEIRRRFRRRGRWKLRAYQLFGRALDAVPSWRIATTDKEWKARLGETQ